MSDPDEKANDQTKEPSQSSESTSDKKEGGPAQAFKDMESSFHKLSGGLEVALSQIHQIHQTSESYKDKFLVANDLLLEKGRSPAIGVLFRAYNNIYRSSLISSNANELVDILECIESDLNSIDIEVIKPKTSIEIDYRVMEVVDTSKKGLKDILKKDNRPC